MTSFKYVTYDLEMEGEPGAFWHIFSMDTDEKDSLDGGSLLTIKGPDTEEMRLAVEAICRAIDVAVDIAERAS